MMIIIPTLLLVKIKEVKHLVKIDSSYNYKFKVSNKMEPVIYEYKKDVV